MATLPPELRKLQTDGVSVTVSSLLRYQQLSTLLNLAPKRTPQARLAGTYLTKHKGRGMEFDEARHYQPGDDIRAIDWRVTARTGKTHTKVYREERERPVFILCDMSASMRFGTQLLLKSVQAAHMAALISWAAAGRGDKVGALIFADDYHRECKPLSRKRAVLGLCHELINAHAHLPAPDAERPDAAFTDACARLRRLARPGSLVYLLSDFDALTDTARPHLTHLGQHCEVHAVHITDPLDQSLPDVSLVQPVSVTDGHARQTWLLGDKKQQSMYQAWRSERLSSADSLLRQAGATLHTISAGKPLDDQLLRFQGRLA